MILEKGNMWDIFFDTDVFMITTNPIIRNDGAVVMGGGIALQAKDRYPELPFIFGRQLRNGAEVVNQQFVGYIGSFEEVPIYYFMVKDHWRNQASLEIINKSVYAILNDPDLNLKNRRIDLNFPDIGNEKLNRSQVLPLLEELPDNVHVWEFN